MNHTSQNSQSMDSSQMNYYGVAKVEIVKTNILLCRFVISIELKVVDWKQLEERVSRDHSHRRRRH